MNTPQLVLIPPPYEMKGDPRFRDDGTFYLIRYSGRFYAGTVEKQHYGWNLDAVYDAGLQMNSSGIEEIFEIVGGKATRPEPIFEILAAAIAEVRTTDE